MPVEVRYHVAGREVTADDFAQALADAENPFLAPVVDPAAGEGEMPWSREYKASRREQRWGRRRGSAGYGRRRRG